MLRRDRETPGLTLKEVKPSVIPTPQTIEKPEPIPENKAFSPSEHVQFLRDTITEMIDSEMTTVFFNQWHPDDIKTLNGVLSMEALHGSEIGEFANILRWQMKKTKISPIGPATHTKDEIRKIFVNFKNEFKKRVDTKLPPRLILGITGETTKAEILKRHSELYSAQKNKGKGQPQDFVSHLIGIAWGRLSAELEKSKDEKMEGKPESWIDLEREHKYTSLITSLEKMTSTEQITWLGIILETEFTPEQLQKIKLKIVDNADSSKIANYKIRRPIIECADVATVQLLAKKAKIAEAEKAGGFCLSGLLRKKGLGDIDLIVTIPNSSTTNHEIRHSIEPIKRYGLDRAISEVFAYAEKYASSGEWEKLEEKVVKEVYFDNYKTDLRGVDPKIHDKFTDDEINLFRKKVHQTVEQLKKRVAEIGEIPALRELITAQSIDDYADEEFRKMKARVMGAKIR